MRLIIPGFALSPSCLLGFSGFLSHPYPSSGHFLRFFLRGSSDSLPSPVAPFPTSLGFFFPKFFFQAREVP